MPHLSRQRCWVRPEYWQVDKPKKRENLAWGSCYADLTATDTREAGIPPSKRKKKIKKTIIGSLQTKQSLIYRVTLAILGVAESTSRGRSYI